MANCSKCGTKLWLFTRKHKFRDGSIMCTPCFERWNLKKAKKKKENVKNEESIRSKQQDINLRENKHHSTVSSKTLDPERNKHKKQMRSTNNSKPLNSIKIGDKDLKQLSKDEMERLRYLFLVRFGLNKKSVKVPPDSSGYYSTNCWLCLYRGSEFAKYYKGFRRLCPRCTKIVKSDIYAKILSITDEKEREQIKQNIENEKMKLQEQRKKEEKRKKIEKVRLQEQRKREEKRKEEEARREEEMKKNKPIIMSYISRYLSNKREMYLHILALHRNRERNALFDKHSLKRAREYHQEWLNELEIESQKTSTVSRHNLDVILNTKKMCNAVLDFLDDLEKISKLLEKKGIHTNYFEMISLFAEVIENEKNKEYDIIVTPVYKILSKKLGNKLSNESVIKNIMTIQNDPHIEFDFWVFTFKLLDKFELEYEKKEIYSLAKKIHEDNTLEEFEKTLGSSQDDNLGDFTELNGHEFEEYLKKLFELLRYTVIKTPLSGDQGADLIMSKDSERLVVQAKKYNGKVSNKAIQEIVAAKNHYEANKALVVTNSFFTKSAINLALSNDVELWNGTRLNSVIKDIKTETGGKKETLKMTFVCKQCENEFDQGIDVRDEPIILLKCPHCGTIIGTSINTKTWKCEHCSKNFVTKAELEKHKKTCIIDNCDNH